MGLKNAAPEIALEGLEAREFLDAARALCKSDKDHYWIDIYEDYFTRTNTLTEAQYAATLRYHSSLRNWTPTPPPVTKPTLVPDLPVTKRTRENWRDKGYRRLKDLIIETKVTTIREMGLINHKAASTLYWLAKGDGRRWKPFQDLLNANAVAKGILVTEEPSTHQLSIELTAKPRWGLTWAQVAYIISGTLMAVGLGLSMKAL